MNFFLPIIPQYLAFYRKYEDEVILVIANLSRFSQVVELDLSEFSGYIPIEIFSRNKFPSIKDSFYMLTLNPFDYYWFLLDKKKEHVNLPDEKEIPELTITKNLKTTFEDDDRDYLIEIIKNYLRHCGWFNPGEEKIQGIDFIDEIPLGSATTKDWLLIVSVNYIDRLPETYQLAVTLVEGDRAKRVYQEFPNAIISKIRTEGEEKYLIDGLFDEEFRLSFFKTLIRKRLLKSDQGELAVTISNRAKKYIYSEQLLSPAFLAKSENINMNIFFSNSLALKFYRKVEEGISPGVEVLKAVSDNSEFFNVTPFAGAVFYRQKNSSPVTIALIKEYVTNQGNAFTYMKDSAKRFFDKAASLPREELEKITFPADMFFDIHSLNNSKFLEEVGDRMNFEMIRILGRRTAELHLVLNSVTDDPAFYPEQFTLLYQRSLYQSGRSLIKNAFRNIRMNGNKIPEKLKDIIPEVLSNEEIYLEFVEQNIKNKTGCKENQNSWELSFKAGFIYRKGFCNF